MVLRKQELKKFLIWMRNGISFAVTWFLILLLAGSYGLNIPQIAVTTLTKMVVLTAGGTLLFCICFTKLILVRWSFIKRLNFPCATQGITLCLWFKKQSRGKGQLIIFN